MRSRSGPAFWIAPERFMPTDWRWIHADVQPRRHWAHVPQTMFGSMTTVSPIRVAGNAFADRFDRPERLVALDPWVARRRPRPSEDAEIRPAQPDATDRDPDVIGPRSGSGTSPTTIRPASTRSAAFMRSGPGACGGSPRAVGPGRVSTHHPPGASAGSVEKWSPCASSAHLEHATTAASRDCR